MQPDTNRSTSSSSTCSKKRPIKSCRRKRAILPKKIFRSGCAGWGTSSSLAILLQTITSAAHGVAWARPNLALFMASWLTSPLAIVIALSVVIGLLMIVLFGYTSDQKAIAIAKDQLKAHLLAVRLYRDQLHVVMGSYGKVLRGTGRYLKLAFKPLLYVIVPITLMIVQIDRYLGATPIPSNAPFLVTVHTTGGDALNDVTL